MDEHGLFNVFPQHLGGFPRLFQESNFTPLLWAAAGGHVQATKSLLEALEQSVGAS